MRDYATGCKTGLTNQRERERESFKGEGEGVVGKYVLY